MKRRVIRLAFFVLAGAIVNVAIAWTAALELWGRQYEPPADVPNVHHWPSVVPDHWPSSARVMRLDSASRAITQHSAYLGTRNEPKRVFGIMCYDFGWPTFAMHSEFWHEYELSDRNQASIVYHSKDHPTATFWLNGLQMGEKYDNLPLQPIWPGFAINTIFYAAILWALFAAPGRVRRWRRVKRGLCPACAYPVGTSDVCTECGQGVMPRVER